MKPRKSSIIYIIPRISHKCAYILSDHEILLCPFYLLSLLQRSKICYSTHCDMLLVNIRIIQG